MTETAQQDAVRFLKEQHDTVRQLFKTIGEESGETRREQFEIVTRLLAVHETAEEEVVHPLSRTIIDAGDRVIDDRLEEERAAKEMLRELMEADIDSDGFEASLLLLRNAVLTHARYEERYEFPQLRAKVPAERLTSLASAVRAAEKMAPTRPHPGVETATQNLVAGPALAVADRVRDLVRDAMGKSDRT